MPGQPRFRRARSADEIKTVDVQEKVVEAQEQARRTRVAWENGTEVKLIRPDRSIERATIIDSWKGSFAMVYVVETASGQKTVSGDRIQGRWKEKR